ncbi:MAG: undecaprenyldiphospho-muramoylpentapeptide beta-N-acetylglucosaminyltransferase [Defluviitaleaceae bacterium]|nr:undecaprenyldiphospho-muramoylpentapeptide beta-N-acetylglucosaminyltransferase [Defluviitaleaceae bacterium]
MRKVIALTGGGTAGHVVPNIALVDALRQAGFDVHYIGAANSIESELSRDAGLTFHAISTGKLRRSLSPADTLKNLRDQFAFAKGIYDARRVMAALRPSLIFSKGGYVGVPVVLAARCLGIKSLIHESDITPGLANRLSFPFAARICVSFPETLARVPSGKGVLTGTPLRREIFGGDRQKGLRLAGFSDTLPVLMVVGGSSGSRVINETVRFALPELLADFQVLHMVGKGNLEKTAAPGYAQFEYLKSDLPHVLAASDIVISRAGANAIQEFLALRKPALLIPLSKTSRGDQVQNAESFLRHGYANVLREEDLTPSQLAAQARDLYSTRQVYIEKMSRAKQSNGRDETIKLILSSVQ